MLRTLLLLIALVVLIVIGLVWAGVVNLRQQPDGGVSVETRDVEVGTTTQNVQVPLPRVGVKDDGNEAAGQAEGAAPAPANGQ